MECDKDDYDCVVGQCFKELCRGFGRAWARESYIERILSRLTR